MSAAPGAISVRTIRALAELPAVGELWRTLQWHPWSDLDYYVERLAAQAEFVRPHVLVVERDGVPVALVAASLRRETLAFGIGSVKPLRSRALVLRVGGGALMGETSEPVMRAVLAALVEALARREANVAYLHQVDSESALLRCVAELPSLARDRWSRPVGGWMLELPESHAAYLAGRSRNVRRNLKRYATLLESSLGEFEIVCYREPRDLERVMSDSAAVSRLTYHHRIGVGFEDSPSVREVIAHALEAGWLRAYLLYSRGRPIAFWHGMVYGRTFFTRDTGYDPEFAELRPGNYLLNKVIEDFCRTHEVERFDYGIMDLDYKRSFGTRRYERSSLYVFSRGPKGLWLWTTRSLSGAADRVARRVLGSRARKWARRLGGLGGHSLPQHDGTSDERPATSDAELGAEKA